MKGSGFLSKDFLQEFDFFSKVDKSSVKSSSIGGTFTFVVFLIIAFLFIQEFISFRTVEFKEYVSVDRSGNGVMDVSIDIAFPTVNCQDIVFNGQTMVGVSHTEVTLAKMAYNITVPNVVWCKPCQSHLPISSQGCCRCEQVAETYNHFRPFLYPNYPPECYYIHNNHDHQGCRIIATLKAPKMKGLLYFVTMRMQDATPIWDHSIPVLSFGNPFPGMQNILSGYVHKMDSNLGKDYKLQRTTYTVQLIPTIYDDLYYDPIYSVQYTASTHTELMEANQLSGVFIQYDLSPILVTKEELDRSFFHLLTRLCAILGGVWVISGVFYSAFLRHLIRNLDRKSGTS